VIYLKLLGDQALDNFSLVEAKELHEEALLLATQDEALSKERGPLQRRMARRHYLQGEAAEAEELLTQVYIYMYVTVYTCTCTCIWIERERERDKAAHGEEALVAWGGG